MKTNSQNLAPKESCIIIDFDKTVTLGKVNGVSVPSIISILISGGHISPDYAAAAQALFDKYHPIEIDTSVSDEDKKLAMLEWWTLHFDLLLKSGLTLDHVRAASQSSAIQIRKGFTELLECTRVNNIPMIVFSASGLGYEAIKFVFEREGIHSENLMIVSNQFIWDENGNATGRVMPTITSLSKDGYLLKTTKAWDLIKDKTTALVVGDGLHDVHMSDGIDFERVYAVGVVNDPSEENVAKYRSVFDDVLLDFEPFDDLTLLFKK
jgi:HAD superfamily hydrolase (TIGR01544 family)